MNAPQDPKLIATSAPADMYAARRRIHPRQLEGFYHRLRTTVRVLALGGIFLLPWLQWAGEPLVWLDLPARRFHVFGGTFFADDVFISAWVLIISAFALFTFTNIAGRVLCGYACPHSMYFSLFIAIEEFIEGSALQRRKLDRDGLDGRARLRRATTWVVWLAFAFAFAFSVMALFVPARELAPSLVAGTVGGWTLFWLAFLTVGCFVFAGFLREQACFYMCPYARFQAAMYDKDTLVVSYDAARGEPRSARKRGGDGAGDCVDCRLCVDVCPVGIDIREGMQYQCIQCGLCVDACKPVMERLGRPTGLVRYSTQNLVEHGLRPFRLARPRLVGYACAMTLMASVFVYYMSNRVPFDLEVIRERNSLYREVTVASVRDSLVENSFRLKVANKTDRAQAFVLAADGLPELQWIGDRQVVAGPGEILELPVRLRVARSALRPGVNDFSFELRGEQADGTHSVIVREQHFFGPAP
jgi:cytochrome c oxidase accessory protein FixG